MKEYLKNDDNYDLAVKIMDSKKTLIACMDMKKFISKVVEAVDESEDFDFRSERAKKYINEKEPIFIFKTTNEKILKEIEKSTNNTDKQNMLTNELVNKVKDQILKKIEYFLTDCIMDKEKYDAIFKYLPSEISETFLTNIYIIRVGLADNSIVVRYFV